MGLLVFCAKRWNSMIHRRQTDAKAFSMNVFIDQERKLGDRRWSDTVVVSTINDVNQGSEEDEIRVEILLKDVFPGTLWEIIEYLHSGGSMVARLKLKGIDGRAHKAWNLRLNLTQHGETYQVRTCEGLTDWKLFLDYMGGGAWPFLVGGLICLVNSVNERDLGF